MASEISDNLADIGQYMSATDTTSTSEEVNENDIFGEKSSTSNDNEKGLNSDLNIVNKYCDNLLKLNDLDRNDYQASTSIVNGNTSDLLELKKENELHNLILDNRSCDSSANYLEVERVLEPDKKIYLENSVENSIGKESKSKEFNLCGDHKKHGECNMGIPEPSVMKLKSSPDITLGFEKCLPSKTLKKTYDDTTLSKVSGDDKENLISFMKELSLKTKLEEITSLNLIQLGLKSVDYDFSPLINVTSIDFSNNNLTSLPDSLGCLKQCARLVLSNNKLTAIPIVLYKYFYFIKDLDISHNCIIDFCMAPLCITYLVHLNASHNKIIALPRWIFHDIPSCLKSLNLSFNPCFKEKIGPLFCDTFETNKISSRVTELDISTTGFNSTNIHILKMFPSLKILRISSGPNTLNHCSNSLIELPGDFLNQMPLEELHVEDSNLTCLPENIDKMSHLKVINMSNNNISWFPERIVHLECLSIVVASKCCLAYLPKEMGCLTSLTELWLSYNDISSLPDMKDCKNLKVLDLYSNSFYQLPCTLAHLKLEAFDICCNYFNSATYTQPSDNALYETLKTRLREKLSVSGNRLDSIKIDHHSGKSSYSGSYSSSLNSWGSHNSRRSKRSTPSSSFERHSLISSKQDESWDVDPDDAWDPDLYSDLQKWTSEDSLSRCRFLASLTNREHYFCPYRESSNFYQNLYVGYTGADEQGQFEDA